MNKEKYCEPSLSCFECQSREKNEWCVLTKEELTEFDKAKKPRRYVGGEFVFHEGDPCEGVHCVESGLIALRKYDVDGHATLVGLVNPGRTLGYRSLLSNSSHVVSAEVVKPSRICFIDRGTVRKLLDTNPALGFQFLRRAAKDLGHATERYHQGVTLSVRDRFVHLLLIFRNKYGVRNEDGSLLIDLPVSRQDLAALVGTRPETLARTIRQLEDEGLAHFEGRNLTVPSERDLFEELELVA